MTVPVGFLNGVVSAFNGNFSSLTPSNGTLKTNGQLWIGSTVPNAVNTTINVGTITSPLGTLSIGYSSPNITMDLAGSHVAIETINGDTGSITGNTVTIYANNSGNICGSTVKFVNSGTISTMNVSDLSGNTFVGLTCGSTGISGSGNTGYGFSVMASVSSGTSNTGYGNSPLINLTSGSFNTAAGFSALHGVATTNNNTGMGYLAGYLITGSNNTLLGTSTGYNGSNAGITSGSNNTLIGYAAGAAYTSSESNNIILGYNIGGTAAESNVTRIGNGSTASCFITGIEGVSVANTNITTINTSTSQLGSVAQVGVPNGGTGVASFTAYSVICGGTTSTGNLQNVSGVGTAGQVLTSNGASALPTWQSGASVLAVTTVNHAASPYTVLAADEFLAVTVAGGVVTVKLPNAPTTGRVITVKDSTGAAATSNISVTTVGGTVTIDGQTTYTMATNYQSISVVFDGSNYEVF